MSNQDKKEKTEYRLIDVGDGIEIIKVYYENENSKSIYGISDPMEMVANTADDLQDLLVNSLSAFNRPMLSYDDIA